MREVPESYLEVGECNGKIPFVPLYMENDFTEGLRSLSEIQKYPLGKGFKPYKYYPVANSRNATFRVIDIDALAEDKQLRDIISIRPVLEATSSYMTYSDFNEYQSKIGSYYERQREFGFDFFGIIKSEFRNSIKFQTNDFNLSSTQKIFGLIDVGVVLNSYTLNLGNLRQVYSYLTPKFKSDYYHYSPDKLIDWYGTHVLTGYDDGGKVIGCYRGIAEDDVKKSEKVEYFTDMMKFTFSLGFDHLKSPSKVFSNNQAMEIPQSESGGLSYKEMKDKFSKFEVFLITKGGNPGLGITNFVGPKDPENFGIDLRAWGATIKDSETALIYKIHDRGLIPLDYFILEDNLKKHLAMYQTNDTKIVQRNPTFYLDPSGYGYDVFIQSRFGDLIRISDGKLRRQKEGGGILHYTELPSVDSFPIMFELDNWGSRNINNGMPIYTCRSKEYCSELGEYLFLDITFPSTLIYDVSGFSNDSFRVFTVEGDPSAIKYLYFVTPNGKFAFAILNDYLAELYGLKLESIPVEKINSDYLLDVKIIAL